MDFFYNNEEKNIKILNQMAKQANQRILRLERLTGRKQPFAVKELADRLYKYHGLTKHKGRGIKVRASAYRKDMTSTEVYANIKALDRFLNFETTSTVRGAKKYTKLESEKAGKKLSFAQASTIYRARNEWQQIFDYVNESDFWRYYNANYRYGTTKSFDQFYIDMFTMWESDDVKLNEDMNKMDKNTLNLLHKVYDYITKGD